MAEVAGLIKKLYQVLQIHSLDAFSVPSLTKSYSLFQKMWSQMWSLLMGNFIESYIPINITYIIDSFANFKHSKSHN